MTLSDLYPGISADKQFIDRYKFLEEVDFPTNEEIAAYQLDWVKRYYPQNDAKMKEIVEKLNLDQQQPIVDNDQQVVNEVVQNIEDSLGQWYQTKNRYSAAKIQSTISSDVLKGLNVDLVKYEKMLEALESVYKKLIQPHYSNSNDIKKQLIKIEQAIQQLTSDITSYKAGTFIPNVKEGEGGYLAWAAYIGHALKGQYLEMAATDWLNSKLPKDIKVVTTGNVLGWSFDVFGQKAHKSKKIRTDIMGFDMNLAKELQIEYTLNGKVIKSSIEEMLEQMEKNSGNDTINISNTDYSQIQRVLVFGAQAKSGKGQAIFNQVKIPLNKLVEENALHGNMYALAFRSLMEIASNKDSKILTKSKDYDAMFNFMLGRQLNNIIGRENNLVVTRDGIQTIYDYMVEQWKVNKRIARAVERRINIREPERLNVVRHAKEES